VDNRKSSGISFLTSKTATTAPQPVLVVNDLKHGDSEGTVGLWIGLGTEAYFTNLRLSD